MENFFKTLEAIGEVCASLKEEAEHNANQARARPGQTDESYGNLVPRPSAPPRARQDSASSGYASGLSSTNSSRRNSDPSIDDEILRYEDSVVTSTHSSAAVALRRPPPDQSLDPVGALFGALAIGALGVGAYYVGKNLLAKKQILIENFSECESILKEIKK